MARNLFDISTFATLPQYAAADGINPLLGFGPPESDWDVQKFGLISIWSNAAIDDKAQQLTVGETWYANITQGIISTRTAIRGFRLAMSIPSMNPNNTNPLLTQQARDNAVNVPNTDSFSDSPFTLMPRSSSWQHHVVIPNCPAGHDSDAQRRSSYCFLAAYMMKLIVKSPANVVAGLTDMKRKYESFYGNSRTVRRFNVTLEQATAYKTALLNRELVSQTYTHAIAHTHQNCVGDLHHMDPREVEVLSYLGFEPFSFTGMHAYTLIMELKDFTKLPLDEIVSMFVCNITASALKKVAQIAERYERTTVHPDRDVTFRYCTLWGPQYFASVRSRNCAALVFAVAHAWKSLGLGAQNGNNSDPTRIAALNSLSDYLKKTLQQTGERAADLLKQKMR